MKGGTCGSDVGGKIGSGRGVRPRGDIVFHVVSDEEVVGNGTREIVARMPAA